MYYVLADQFTGELIQVSSDPIVQGERQIVKMRHGEIPDLNKYEWHNGSLAFIEKNSSRFMTQEAFTRRLTEQEMRNIYQASKVSIDVEIWLDRFKMAKEIDLDDPFLVNGLNGLAANGLLSIERVQEILS
jgi:hypothetical protein